MAKQTPSPAFFNALRDQHGSWRKAARAIGAPEAEVNTYSAMMCRAGNGKRPNPRLLSFLYNAGLVQPPTPKVQHRRAGLFHTAEEAETWDRMMAAMGTTTTEYMRRLIAEWQSSRVIDTTMCFTASTE